jgi:phosphoadenosine phosphosulfate reductase
VQWAFEHLPSQHVLSSSFGAQAAVSLHLLSRVEPDIPIVLVDTGYLFNETYRFIDDLTERLGLKLQVYRSLNSPAWHRVAAVGPLMVEKFRRSVWLECALESFIFAE